MAQRLVAALSLLQKGTMTMNRPTFSAGGLSSAPRQISQETLVWANRVFAWEAMGLLNQQRINQPLEGDAAQFLLTEIGPRYRQRVPPFQAPTLPRCSLSA